jgi:hypothetical protein
LAGVGLSQPLNGFGIMGYLAIITTLPKMPID